MPSPVQLKSVTSMPDTLLQDHFLLRIANMPGGGSGQAFEVQNMKAVLPGRSNNVIAVELHRHKRNEPGKRIYPGSFQFSHIDNAKRIVIDAFQKWQDLITDPATGLQRPRGDIITTGEIIIFGADNQPVITRTFYNLWVSNIPDIPLNGSSNSPIEWSGTMSYDYWQEGGIGS